MLKNKIIFFAMLLFSSVAFAADQKVTALTALTAVSPDDLLYAVDDPAGTPASYKLALSNLNSYAPAVVPAGGTYFDMYYTGSTSSAANNTGSSRGFSLDPHYTGTSNMGTFSSLYALANGDHTAGTITDFYSIVGRAFNNSSGNVTKLAGVYGDAKNTSTGTVAGAYGFYQNPVTSGPGAGTITNAVGLQITEPTNSGSGTITNSIGIDIPDFYASTPQGTSSNIALVLGSSIPAGINATLYTVGNLDINSGYIDYDHVGISDSSGTDTGISSTVTRITGNTGTTGELRAIDAKATSLDGSGTVANLVGIDSITDAGNTHTVTTMSAYEALFRTSQASAVATSAYGYRVNDISNTGTMTNTYGVYIGDVTAGTQTNQAYGLYQQDTGARNFFGGSVGIGDSSPAALFTVGTSDAYQIDSSGNTTTTGTIKSTRSTDLGWTVQAAANQACNTTCSTGACVVGIDTVTTAFLACTDATADSCLCAG